MPQQNTTHRFHGISPRNSAATRTHNVIIMRTEYKIITEIIKIKFTTFSAYYTYRYFSIELLTTLKWLKLKANSELSHLVGHRPIRDFTYPAIPTSERTPTFHPVTSFQISI